MSTAERPASRPAEKPTVVTGVVVPGDQRGRLLGFPTANLPLEDGGIADGVYAGTVIDDTDGSEHIAAVSVGRRASFYGRDGVRLLEAHLLDFSGDLYGHPIRVQLQVKLRPQRRYRSAESLVEQLRRDIDATRAWAQEGPTPFLHRGRRRPVAGRRAQNPDDVRRARADRRLAALAEAVDGVHDAEATHELIAERSRIPLAYLRWAYPSTEELLGAARGQSTTGRRIPLHTS